MTGRSTDPLDDELAGVDPKRRALVRKRLKLVRDYLALPSPSRQDDEAFAAELNISPASFLVLVRAYKASGSAAAIPGAKVAIKGTIRDARMPDARTEAAVSQAIAETGVDTTSIALLARVVEICRSTGARAPSIGVVHLRLAKARRTTGAAGIGGLVLDHIALDLPVVVGEAMRLPVLTVVLEGQTARVTGWSVSTNPPTPRAAAAALIMAATRDGPVAGPLHMAIDGSADWKDLCDALAASGVERVGTSASRLRAGSSAFRMLGDRLGGIQLLPRKVNRPEVAQLRSRFLHEMEEAVDAVRAAVETHNAARSVAPLASLVASESRHGLLTALEAFMGEQDANGEP